MTEKRMGRPRTGSLYWAKSGWRARVTVLVDGVSVQKSFDLETKDKSVARIKMKRLVKALDESEGRAPDELSKEAKRVETFEEAARRIVGESSIRSKERRLDRLEKHVFAAIGGKPVNELVAGDGRDILDGLAARGLSRQLCTHVKNDISSVLGELWRADMLTENVMLKVRVPKGAKVDRRERVVLTDPELATYLAWEHPIESRRGAVLERQTMACLSRMFGGLRIGDIRALRWEMLDTQGGFRHGWAPRQKTARPQLLAVPEMLRPILRDWWERTGRKSEGVVFPVRKGERAGEEKKVASVVNHFRRDLRRAFALEEWNPETGRFEAASDRVVTPREREIFEDTPFTRRVDFHSFRRSYKQALADAGVDLQQAMALSGATDAKAHARYLANTSKMRELPAAALPSICIGRAETEQGVGEASHETGPFSAAMRSGRRDSNPRPRAWEARALPTELLPPIRCGARSLLCSTSGRTAASGSEPVWRTR